MQRKNACQRMTEGTKREIESEEVEKRCGYSLRRFRRKYSEFLSKGEDSFVHGNKGKS